MDSSSSNQQQERKLSEVEELIRQQMGQAGFPLAGGPINKQLVESFLELRSLQERAQEQAKVRTEYQAREEKLRADYQERERTFITEYHEREMKRDFQVNEFSATWRALAEENQALKAENQNLRQQLLALGQKVPRSVGDELLLEGGKAALRNFFRGGA